MVDYIHERNIVMEKIGGNPENWYDEDEHYLDDLHVFMSDYYKKMWNLQLNLKSSKN